MSEHTRRLPRLLVPTELSELLEEGTFALEMAVELLRLARNHSWGEAAALERRLYIQVGTFRELLMPIYEELVLAHQLSGRELPPLNCQPGYSATDLAFRFVWDTLACFCPPANDEPLNLGLDKAVRTSEARVVFTDRSPPLDERASHILPELMEDEVLIAGYQRETGIAVQHSSANVQPGSKTTRIPQFASTARELAQEVGADLTLVESFLRRFAEARPDCVFTIENPRRNEPRRLYRTADALPALRKHLGLG